MKNVIVTGANGFVGSNVCRELSAQGVKVIAVIKDTNEDISNILPLENVEIVYCELGEIEKLTEKTPTSDYDVFYHFAWVGSAGPLRMDEEIQLQNALWTAKALRTAHKLGCKKFVNAGTITEKETFMAVYTQESKPAMPYIYGAGKLAAHSICKPIANQLGIDLCWAIITNTYGVGELSPRLINTSIRKILAGEPLQFTAATQNYDFIYIDDLAKAFVAVGRYGKANKEYVIGSGSARPLKEFLIEMQQAIAPEAEMIFGDVPFTGVDLPLKFFDTTDLEKDCNFKATISFAEGTKRTMQWIKQL